MADKELTRDEELKQIRKNYPLLYPITLALVVIIILLIAGMAIYMDHDAWGYGINVFTSVVSTVATVLILDRLAERRADRKAEEALKLRLVEDAASYVNDVAKNAVYQIARKGWLEGENGILKGADLSSANLQGAELYAANLEGAKLESANLQGANLRGANLVKSRLWFSDLQGAYLLGANLQEADLMDAKLQNADLRTVQLSKAKLTRTNLHGTDLFLANLQGTSLGWNARLGSLDNIMHAEFDETTTLPDGSHWVKETDIRRFTDSNHPDFDSHWEEKIKEYLDFLM